MSSIISEQSVVSLLHSLDIKKSAGYSCSHKKRKICLNSKPSPHFPYCTSCKLLEHIVNKQLVSFLEENAVLDPNQHGFRKGLSTVTRLIQFYYEISSYVNYRKQLDAVFIDLTKAFDKVPHRKLVKVLMDLGVPSCLIRWIITYLRNRQQFVDVNGTYSRMLDVYSGVPQCSVLGPLLFFFLVYVNGLFG